MSSDPEVQRWQRKYPRFPGVAECVRLITARKAKGAWADIIAEELAKNAADCLPELITVYRESSSEEVRLYVLMALEVARLPESVPLLAEVLNAGDLRFVPYAERTLQRIDTREARAALWHRA